MNNHDWGLSLRTLEQLAGLPSRLPERLRLLEVPGEVLEDRALCRKLEDFRSSGIVFVIRELMDGKLADMISNETLSGRIDFDRRLRARCEIMGDLGIDLAETGLDPFSMMEEQGRGALAMLKSLFDLCDGKDVKLLLPCRVPAAPGNDFPMERLAAFRRGLLSPGIRYLVDYHIHEPGALELPPGVLSPLGLDTALFRIAYRPDLGNKLEPSALRRALEILAVRTPEPLPVLLAPGAVPVEEDALNRLPGIISAVEQSVEEQPAAESSAAAEEEGPFHE